MRIHTLTYSFQRVLVPASNLGFTLDFRVTLEAKLLGGTRNAGRGARDAGRGLKIWFSIRESRILKDRAAAYLYQDFN